MWEKKKLKYHWMWEKGQGFSTHKPEATVANKDICQKKRETHMQGPWPILRENGSLNINSFFLFHLKLMAPTHDQSFLSSNPPLSLSLSLPSSSSSSSSFVFLKNPRPIKNHCLYAMDNRHFEKKNAIVSMCTSYLNFSFPS